MTTTEQEGDNLPPEQKEDKPESATKAPVMQSTSMHEHKNKQEQVNMTKSATEAQKSFDPEQDKSLEEKDSKQDKPLEEQGSDQPTATTYLRKSKKQLKAERRAAKRAAIAAQKKIDAEKKRQRKAAIAAQKKKAEEEEK